MTEKKDIKDTLLKEVRSILLPEAKGLTCKEFMKTWRMLLGYNFPVRELGFNVPEDFFKSIPDVVTVSWQGSDILLNAVPTEATKHIARMVACQKTSKKRSRGKGRGGYQGSHPRSGLYRPRHDRHGQGFQHSESSTSFAQAYTKVPARTPVVPPVQRGQIQDLLRSYGTGIVAANFEVAFTRKFGQCLSPKNLGFDNLFGLLSTLTDIVELEEIAAGGYRIYSRESKLTETRRVITKMPGSSKNKSPVNRDIPPRFQKKEDTRYMDVSNEQDDLDEADQSAQELAFGDEITEDDNAVASIYPENTACVDLHALTKTNIKELLARHPSGISSAQFPTEYKLYTAQELNLHKLGYHSVIELMSSLSDIVTIKRLGPGDWMLYDARVAQPQTPVEEPSAPIGRQHPQQDLMATAPPLPSIFSETVRQVVNQFPEGIHMHELTQKYEALTGQVLHIGKLGYTSLEALLLQLTGTVRLNCLGKGVTILYPADPSLPYRDDLLFNKHKQQEKRKGVPADAVGPGVIYKHLPLPNDDIGEYLDVFVSHIDSPGRIWLQIKGPGTTEALEDLMDRLDNFYNNPIGEDYLMADSLLRVGLVCVALYPEDNNWHRVTITGLRDLDFVEVYFVDYGTSCTVTRRSIKLLSSRFLRLPAQAIRARLANILPTDKSRWTRSAKMRLLDLCSFKPLKALVTDIDKHLIVSVCLCDTSGEEDIHINDVLVAEEHAVVSVDTDCSPVAHNITMDLLGSPDVWRERSLSESNQLKLPITAPQESDDAVCRSEKTESSSEYEARVPTNIRYAELCDGHTLHLVRLEDKCWAIAGDISRLIWDKDQLGSRIRKSGLKANALTKLVISEDTHPELFNEFEECEVPGTFTDEGILRSHVALYHIDSVVKILDLFKHPPSEELRASIVDLAESFDPNDLYWMGEEEEEDDVELALEELEIGLQILNHKRKMTISHMQAATDTEMTTHVEELGRIEEQLRAMNQRITKAKQGPVAAVEAEVSIPAKNTPEESFIGYGVSEQARRPGSEPAASRQLPASTTRPTPLIQTVAPMPTSAGLPLNSFPVFQPLQPGLLPAMHLPIPVPQALSLAPGQPSLPLPQFAAMNLMGDADIGVGRLPSLTPEQEKFLQQYQAILLLSMGRGAGSPQAGNFNQ